MSTVSHDALCLRPTSVDERSLVLEITDELLQRDIPTAPHVTGTLLRRLNSDAETVMEVAVALTPAQRHGHRMLPVPLPLVPSIEESFDALDLDDIECSVLLIAALCTSDRLGLLLDASERTAEEIMTGPLGGCLTVTRGRFAFVDTRMSVWIRHRATDIDSARAHDRLRHAHHRRADQFQIHWHRARGAVERTPDVVPELIRVGRKVSEAGHPDWGFRLAAEAAEHALGAELDEARLVAGTSAIGAGCMEDAADWLGSIFPSGKTDHRGQAMASLLIAELCAHGAVPVFDPVEHRPRTADIDHWHAWARAAGVAAVFCAERGEIQSMRGWLAELREADARAEAEGSVRDCAVALCRTLAGESKTEATASDGPFSGSMVAALHAALNDDIDHGLQLLARAQSGLSREHDPLLRGLERSPIMDGYLAVTEVLLHFWRGDIETARERLLAAAVDLPVGIPFSGLGTTLAQRLDIAVLGTTGVLAHALARTLPGGIRIDRLVDSGLEAYLAGGIEQAAMGATLWHDRGAPEQPLAVPGLDEVGPVLMQERVEPGESGEARVLRRRIRLLPETSWRRECTEIAEAARRVRSPFSRARVEAMLGSAHAIRGDAKAGRRHLLAAQSLFEDSGALAWRDAVDERLGRLGAQIEANARISTVPIDVIADADPLEASRAGWAVVLTDRELEVAMRIVEGAANREIAHDLDVSVRTVEVHAGRIFNKLGVRKRVELTLLAHRTARHL